MARERQGSPADEKKLEQYGVWVKVKPRDVTAPVLDEPFELSDLEPTTPSRGTRPGSRAAGPVAVEENALTAEEEQLLDELETELEPESSSVVSVPEEEPLLEESELPDIESAARAGSSDVELAGGDEELPELEEDLGPASARSQAGAEPAEVDVPLSETVAEEESFDDLAALESELATVTTRTRAVASSGVEAGAGAGGSEEILARIEDELKSIRADLNQLRSDLSGLRASAAEAGGEGPSEEGGIKGGFLDEDEDETIALTGDELDNILNTAEITEEVAEATAESPESEAALPEEASAQDTGGDILGYETPQPEPVEATELNLEEELPGTSAADEEISDGTLVLGDEDLLTIETPEAPAPAQEELPDELVLEEMPSEEGPSAEGLPEIDLEGIPEIETEPAAAAGAGQSDEESETIDLETLDLGEEPKVIDAVPEQVDEVTELEAEDVLEAEEAPAEVEASAAELPEVDLEALAAEAEDLEAVPEAPLVEDLEIGELETVADETPAAQSAENEIEISLEEPQEVPVDEAEVIAEAEEIAAPAEEGAGASGETSAIPDNLKDEIRTVLKYMDHLLEALPDEKIQEFASSDYFVMYKKLFEDLGLGE